jgi:hypothetical protein
MFSENSSHSVAVRSSALHMTAWTASEQEARALAEALYAARPDWRISIDGNNPVFSCDGRIIDFTPPRKGAH